MITDERLSSSTCGLSSPCGRQLEYSCSSAGYSPCFSQLGSHGTPSPTRSNRRQKYMHEYAPPVLIKTDFHRRHTCGRAHTSECAWSCRKTWSAQADIGLLIFQVSLRGALTGLFEREPALGLGPMRELMSLRIPTTVSSCFSTVSMRSSTVFAAPARTASRAANRRAAAKPSESSDPDPDPAPFFFNCESNISIGLAGRGKAVPTPSCTFLTILAALISMRAICQRIFTCLTSFEESG